MLIGETFNSTVKKNYRKYGNFQNEPNFFFGRSLQQGELRIIEPQTIINKLHSITLTTQVSCFSVMTVKHVDRCKYVTAAEDCKHAMNLLRYYRIMYCAMKVDDRSSEMLVIVIYATVVLILILWVIILEK